MLVEELQNAKARIAELEALQHIDNSIDSLDKLNALRDRTLNKLKVGRQSAAGKAIDAFIKELKR